VGGRSEPAILPKKAGRTAGRNEVEDLGTARVAARRGGIRGERRPPCQTEAGGKRRRATRAASASPARQRLKAPTGVTPGEPSKSGARHGGVRAGLGASRRRALKPDRVCPRGGQ